MKVDLYNLQAEKIDQVDLSKEVFGQPTNQALIAQAIRVYLANLRSSYAKTKHRGDIAGTTKKVWSQKGTGRARHGSRKAPIFIGGGSAHGPKGNQNYTLKLSSAMKKAALRSLLSQFLAKDSIMVIKDLDKITPKTKEAKDLISKLEKNNKTLANNPKIGIITTAGSTNTKRAFANLSAVNLLSASSLNVLDLANQEVLIFSHQALESVNKNG